MKTRKTKLRTLMSFALLCPATLWAQAADPAIEPLESDAAGEVVDEVIVQGQRLVDFRIELQAARVRVYDLFNDLNSDDAFDVHCRMEGSTGTRARQHVCRAQFQDDIAQASATAWVTALKETCGLTQECIFSEAANIAKSRAQAEEGKQPLMHKRFVQEMARVVAASPELQQAMLDYQVLEAAYDDARGGRRTRRCDAPDPPPRCTR